MMPRRARRERVSSVTSTPCANTPRTDPSSAYHGLTVTSQKTSKDGRPSACISTRQASLVTDLPVA